MNNFEAKFTGQLERPMSIASFFMFKIQKEREKKMSKVFYQ